MATGMAVWGIDVGRCALKAIKLRPSGAEGQVDIIGQEYVEHATILSQSDDKRHALVTEALERFLSRNDISKDRIVVGVPGQHTLARFSKLPPVEPKRIPDIVRYEADQQIPFDLDEVIWDYQTFQEEDSPDVEVGIFAMKRELVRDYLLPFEQAGIEPVVVQASPLALYNAMQFEQRLSKDTIVMLDVGAENTDLILATQSGLWTRTIPLGGNKFTEALVKSFKLSFSKAENLKRTAATSKYARQVFQAMRPVFAELVQELSRSLGFYRSTHRETELKRIVVMGNAFKLPGLQKYLQQNLQLPVDKCEKLRKATLVDVSDESNFEEQLPSYFVAYGLALQGLDEAKIMPGVSAIKSNLLPPEIVKQVVWRKKKPFFAASAACLLLAAGIVWFRQQSDMRTLAANQGQPVSKMTLARASQVLRSGAGNVAPRQEGAMWLEVAKTFNSEHAKYKNQGADEKEKGELLVELQRNKAVWPRILAAIHQALPIPQAELAAASGPEEYLAAVRKNPKVLKRSKRSEIFIEEFVAHYYQDLDEVDLLDQETGDSGEDLIDAPDDEKRSGFLVTVQCRTPNDGKARFVSRTIKSGLREHGRKPDLGFYINRVVLTEGRGFGEKRTSGSSRPPRGRGRTPRTDRKRGSNKPTGAFKYDPVTDELMNNDWMFELRFDVVLTDLPVKDEEGDAS